MALDPNLRFRFNEPDTVRLPKLQQMLEALLAAEIITGDEVVQALAAIVFPATPGHVLQIGLDGESLTLAAPALPVWGGITGTLTDQADLVAALGAKLDASAYTAADVLAKLLTVDGSGSGLDADTLDGMSSAAFQPAGSYQPLDGDLTAIAALSTLAYGRSFLSLADAAAGRTLLGLGTLATQSGTFSGTSSGTNTGDQTTITGNAGTATALQNARTIALSGKATGTATSFDGTGNITIPITAVTLVAADIPTIAQSQVTNLTTDLSNKQPLDADLTAIAALTTTAFGRSFLPLADAAAARTLISVQPTANPTFTGTVTAPAFVATGAGITANAMTLAGAVSSVFNMTIAGAIKTQFQTVAAGLTIYSDSFAFRNLASGLICDFTLGTINLPAAVAVTSLRINTAAVAGAVAATHTVAVNINGTAARILLAIP